jgi:hypothetical protein
MSSPNGNSDIDPRFTDTPRILQALREAYYDAVRLHRAYGVPMVFWENGQIVHVPADQLECGELPHSKLPGC